MPYLFTFTIICLFSLTESHAETAKVLFDFADPAAMRGWQVEDDGVMGGVSRGNMVHDKAGRLIFHGDVSLENNGGFACRLSRRLGSVAGRSHPAFITAPP